MVNQNTENTCIVAFSLIELIVMLVAVSCLLAAFAPVLTRRMSAERYTAYTSQSLKHLKTDCVSEFNANCLLCEGSTRCIVCELGCPSGKTLDVNKCICK